MVSLLAELFLTGNMRINQMKQAQATIYEHIKVVKDHIEVMGEHIMSGVGPLKSCQGLFGAHDVITNFHPDLNEWVATLIHKEDNMEEALGMKQQTYGNIRNILGQIAC